MNITLLANMMANIPVGQKQHRQERTAGTIQFLGAGTVVTTTGVTAGCVTYKLHLPKDRLLHCQTQEEGRRPISKVK